MMIGSGTLVPGESGVSLKTCLVIAGPDALGASRDLRFGGFGATGYCWILGGGRGTSLKQGPGSGMLRSIVGGEPRKGVSLYARLAGRLDPDDRGCCCQQLCTVLTSVDGGVGSPADGSRCSSVLV